MPYLGIFGLEIWKKNVIFETSTLKYVKFEFFISSVEISSPLFLKVLVLLFLKEWVGVRVCFIKYATFKFFENSLSQEYPTPDLDTNHRLLSPAICNKPSTTQHQLYLTHFHYSYYSYLTLTIRDSDTITMSYVGLTLPSINIQ